MKKDNGKNWNVISLNFPRKNMFLDYFSPQAKTSKLQKYLDNDMDFIVLLVLEK